MYREQPLDPPDAEAVVAATTAALERPVAGAARIHEGENAAYRVDLRDGGRAVLKTPLRTTDATFLAEPRVLELVGRETSVPVPPVLATVPADRGPLRRPHFLTEYRAGRHVEDVLTLSPAERETLAEAAGRHLAALHELRPVAAFGDLRVVGGKLIATPEAGSWTDRFADLTEAAVAGLRGETRVGDPEPRFADLAPAVREALAAFEPPQERIAPALLHNDYRPANLVLAPDGQPFVQAVLDFGRPATGDGLLDLAHAEDALVDMPLGGTERGDHLRRTLRTTYAAGRGLDADRAFGRRYERYRLYARVWRLALFDYWQRFAREDDADATARRWRAFVRRRIAGAAGDS